MTPLARRFGLTRERLTPFRWFDYLALNPELLASGITTARAARRHFRTSGRAEGRQWYVPWPTAITAPLTPCDPTDGGWQTTASILPTARRRPRRSVELELARYSTDQWSIAVGRAAFHRAPSAHLVDAWCAQIDAGTRTRMSVYAEARRASHGIDPFEGVDDASQTASAAPVGRHIDPQQHDSLPAVSVLCSLYRADAHLVRLLDNVVGQTIFDSCEFRMVLVDPSPFERTTLEAAAHIHPNIHIDLVTERIGIYAAWNRAARAARGRYLTNMNADDLRRADSLERQSAILDASPWVDVVSQDVFMSTRPGASWDEYASTGRRTHFPPATLATFMSYVNPPHNAPMWRRSLHDRVGWFDERFVSAGDTDFWIRCARDGALFAKDREIHVGYFHNPVGLSTSPDSVGITEHRSIIDAHSDLLPYGAAPRGLGAPTVGDRPRARVDRVTAAFVDRWSNAGRSTHPTTSASAERTVVFDDHAVAVGDATARAAWTSILAELTPALLAAAGISLTILDRSGVFTASGHHVVPFSERPWNTRYPAPDRELISRACAHLGADLFVSSTHTFAIGTPSALIDPTMGAWRPAMPASEREALEAALASTVAGCIDAIDAETFLTGLRYSLDTPVTRSTEFEVALTELQTQQLRWQR